jgi:hypothetical protein
VNGFDVLERVQERIKEEIEMNADYLSRGSAEDYSDYAGQCGKLKGLRSALDTIDNALLPTKEDGDE